MIVDDGKNKTRHHLRNPSEAVLLTGIIWREMHHFTKDCVLLVLASEYYESTDYINDYFQFLSLATEND